MDNDMPKAIIFSDSTRIILDKIESYYTIKQTLYISCIGYADSYTIDFPNSEQAEGAVRKLDSIFVAVVL